MNILKDSCKTAPHRDEDALLVQNLKEYFGHYSEFIPSKSGGSSFGIGHVNGKVKYDVKNFLDQAKESLSMNIFECMQRSQDHFVVDLFGA